MSAKFMYWMQLNDGGGKQRIIYRPSNYTLLSTTYMYLFKSLKVSEWSLQPILIAFVILFLKVLNIDFPLIFISLNAVESSLLL